MFSIGIDVGYNSIKVVVVDEKYRPIFTDTTYHHGHLQQHLMTMWQRLIQAVPMDQVAYGMVTGNGHGWLTHQGDWTYVQETIALIEGTRMINPKIRTVMAIGGQSSYFVSQVHERPEVQYSQGCSAGTGSFIEEQMHRLDLNVQTFDQLALGATHVPSIAGRCTVFAKTDMIHHQQAGVPTDQILRGLARAVAKNYKNLAMKNGALSAPVLIAGGVSRFQVMVDELMYVTGLSPKDCVLMEQPETIFALGAAVYARTHHVQFNGFLLNHPHDLKHQGKILKPLSDTTMKTHEELHCIFDDHGLKSGFLGIDIGSTSTNLVVVDENQVVLAYHYGRTKGAPLVALQKGLLDIQSKLGDDFIILHLGATGSGRMLAANALGLALVKDEITAHAKGTFAMDPSVDTVIEIGGQDSKFMRLKKGEVVTFKMNKVCAAGTGAFIEEQAHKLGLSLSDFQSQALESLAPAYLGDKCTVFIENSVMAQRMQGAGHGDVAAGLCYGVAQNYLSKVVGDLSLGEKVAFQGGLAHNLGVMRAFEQLLNRPIHRLPFFSVLGAVGVSLLSYEAFIKPDFQKNPRTLSELLNKMKPNGSTVQPIIEQMEQDLSQVLEQKLFMGEDRPTTNSNRPVIGIPRVLFLHKLFPLFHTFFNHIGYEVLLSPLTDAGIKEKSDDLPMAEVCYPIKLVQGHIAYLMDQGVSYIFLPNLLSMEHEQSKTRTNCGCVYMAHLSDMMAAQFEFEKKGVQLLAPRLDLGFGKHMMLTAMLGIGLRLGASKAQSLLGLKKGMQRLKAYIRYLEKQGSAALESLKKDEIAFVLVTRTYGIKDPGLNMGIPSHLKALGHKVLTLSNLKAHDEDLFDTYSNLYWPFGQHMLGGAKIIAEHPNLYAIYLTNHGCGPDDIIAKYFQKVMGQKPYLHLEVDEHTSVIGVETRIEAFINQIKHNTCTTQAVLPTPIVHYGNVKPDEHGRIYIPNLAPYSGLFASQLNHIGYDVEILPLFDLKDQNQDGFYYETKDLFAFKILSGMIQTFLNLQTQKKPITLLVPTYEGPEVMGQYSLVLSQMLRDQGFKNLKMLSPFIEDFLYDPVLFDCLFKAIEQGDSIRRLPKDKRHKKTILLEGDPLLVYHEGLILPIKERVQACDYELVQGSLLIGLIAIFKQHHQHKTGANKAMGDRHLNRLEELMAAEPVAQGKIILASMHENTASVKRILATKDRGLNAMPVLWLPLDGPINHDQSLKVDTFMTYLGDAPLTHRAIHDQKPLKNSNPVLNNWTDNLSVGLKPVRVDDGA